MDRARILIIGGGVVGCAVAYAVSRRWQDVFLVEQLPKLGMATSSRNSGVIHSGIYYPSGTLKARLCPEGNRRTYEFCAEHNVPHRRTGKLIVAADSREEEELHALLALGQANGVEGLRLIGPAEIRAREPHIVGTAAIDVPSTGIISAEDLVKTFARVASAQGAEIVTHARVEALEPQRDSIRVTLRIGDDVTAKQETIEAACVVNSAGLYADDVAAMLGNRSWRIYPVRGEYCEVRGPRAALVNGLVYPMPHPDGFVLGVHFTKTLWGTLLVGPTGSYVEGKDNYERDRLPISHFAKSAKILLPEIEESDLRLSYSGLRPKLVPPGGKGPFDFVITRDPNVPQAIQLVGIESPGLTCCLAIAERAAALAAETFA